MNFRKTALALLLACPLVALVAHPAAAQTGPTFNFVGPGYSSQAGIVNISLTGSSANFISVYAGRYQGNLNGGPTFNIFCTDVHHDIGPPNFYTADVSQNLTNPIATGNDSYGGYNGGLATSIYNGDYQVSATSAQALQRADEVAWLADHYLNSATLSSQQSTALGLSVWDIIQNGGTDYGSGAILTMDSGGHTTYDSLITGYEASALNAVNGGYNSSNSARWIQAVSPDAQDYVYEVTPEPKTSMLFLSFGVIGLGCWLRRRRANA